MGVNWLSKKLFTKHSNVSGKGTFAKINIKKGELLAAFGGKVITINPQWKKLPKNLGYLYIQIADNLCIGPKTIKDAGDGDYVNHSCDPNSGIKGQIFLAALRDISKNEEIKFDYAMVLSGNPFKMKCNCNSKQCRKIVTTEDWKNKNIQKRYKGWFSLYLQEKINNLNNMKKDVSKFSYL